MAANAAALAAGRSNYNRYTSSRPAVLGLAKLLVLSICQITTVSAVPVKAFFGITEADTPKDADDASLWLYLGIAAVLVLLGGAFAGLTIALMGQDGVYLQVIATSGEGKEQRHAQKVFALLQKGKHWVLVTLLLSNVIVNETLPIILDRSLGGGWPAVLGSTALIVIFGEVIPQSVCVRYGLAIGAYMSTFVLGLMWLLAPIAWPTAKLLDKLLGEDHGTVYKKSGLKTLVTLHKTLGPSPSDRLNEDEVTIISAVLDLKGKAVGEIMTPMEDVFTMSSDTILDEEKMNIILTAGYSRIPIYEPGNEENFLGMLLVKILITYDPEDCKRVSEFALATLPETRPETSCLDIVNFFQEGKSHMVLVSEFPGENYGAMGVVTLEDVIEELIGEEIIDESDVYIDVHKAIRRMAPAPKARVSKGIVVEAPKDAEEPRLIEFADDEQNNGTAAKRLTSDDRRVTSPIVLASSPKTTFIKRVPTSSDGTITVRGNANDMRDQLRHLGPSNLASRPKTTKYNKVKIKPGHPEYLRSSSAGQVKTTSQQEIVFEADENEHGVHGGEGEGLLQSAGKHASDGVHALQQGYGSMDRRFSKTPSLTHQKSDGTWKSDKFGSSAIPTLQKQQDDESGGSISSVSTGTSSPTRRKMGVARSGSITENIIEAGGVRKVVLETNSPEQDEADDGSLHPGSREGIRSSVSLGVDGQTDRDGNGSAQGEERKRKPKGRKKRQAKKEEDSADK